jgi:ribonuclease H / adenosylcobalamin/alpha-ribazole phosphatase
MRRGAAADGAAGGGTAGSGGPAGTAGSWEPPSGPATRLILVRHGATALTAQRRYSGRGDVPLTDEGVAQAEAVARRVSTLVPEVTAVVSSPLVRCTATATQVAAAAGGVPLVVDPDVIECDFGEWEGHTGAEVRARWPEAFEAWQRSTAVAPPGGESFQQVAQRVRRAAVRLGAAYPAAAVVVVVSHVSPLKLLLRDALAASDLFLRRLFLDPAGMSVLDRYPDGAVAVRSVNDTAHLPARPPESGTVER